MMILIKKKFESWKTNCSLYFCSIRKKKKRSHFGPGATFNKILKKVASGELNKSTKELCIKRLGKILAK